MLYFDRDLEKAFLMTLSKTGIVSCWKTKVWNGFLDFEGERRQYDQLDRKGLEHTDADQYTAKRISLTRLLKTIGGHDTGGLHGKQSTLGYQPVELKGWS